MKRDRTRFYVRSERCDQCLFSSNKIVSEDRKAEIIATTTRRGKHFVCHKATFVGDSYCCRGYYDEVGEKTLIIKLARDLNLVTFI